MVDNDFDFDVGGFACPTHECDSPRLDSTDAVPPSCSSPARGLLGGEVGAWFLVHHPKHEQTHSQGAPPGHRPRRRSGAPGARQAGSRAEARVQRKAAVAPRGAPRKARAGEVDTQQSLEAALQKVRCRDALNTAPSPTLTLVSGFVIAVAWPGWANSTTRRYANVAGNHEKMIWRLASQRAAPNPGAAILQARTTGTPAPGRTA